MSFLVRARRAWRGWSDKGNLVPQYYHVLCPEGHHLQGERTESYQALRCPSCGEGVFVLPRSPLPDPPKPSAKGKPAPRGGDEAEDLGYEEPHELADHLSPAELAPGPRDHAAASVSDVEIDYSEAEPPRPARRSVAETDARRDRVDSRNQRRRDDSGSRPAARGDEEDDSPRLIELPARPSLGERIHKNRNALIFMGTALIVVATIALSHWKQRRQMLPSLVERGRTEGIAALNQGRFDTANEILSTASRAVDELGGDVEGADDVRQAAREAAILADRSLETLETILDRSARLEPAERDKMFKTLYQGRSFIVDDHVRAAGEGSRGGYDIEYRVGVPGNPRPRVGKIDFDGFRLFEVLKPKPGQRVVFGARLKKLRYDESEDIWYFEIEPESGALMSWKPLEAIDGTRWEDPPPTNDPRPAALFNPPNLRPIEPLISDLKLVQESRKSINLSFASSWTTPAAWLSICTLAEPTNVVDAKRFAKNPDRWLGKEIVIDDRVKFFRPHPGRGLDELVLQAAEGVIFELPPPLRPDRAERSAGSARVRGVPRKTNQGTIVFAVKELELLPSDRDRLDAAIARLDPRDYSGRAAWGYWANRRGETYDDAKLRERGATLEEDAILLEADEHLVVDRPSLWLELARRAREHGLSQTLSAALAHRAFRSKINTTASHEAMAPILKEIEAFFPQAATTRFTRPKDFDEWLARYQADPAGAYRRAPKPVQDMLDRTLWADAIEARLRAAVKHSPRRGIEFAAEAREKLPERLKVADELRDLGVEASTKAVSELKESEIKALAESFDKGGGNSARLLDLYRHWLDDLREKKLGKNDVEGRITLAEQYIKLLKDRDSAASLLAAAEAIDAEAPKLVDAYRRLGFQKVNGKWTDPSKKPEQVAGLAEREGEEKKSRKKDLIDMTRDDVISRMGGNPDAIVRVATQGAVLEQWIYRLNRGAHYINLTRSAGDSQALVGAHFILP